MLTSLLPPTITPALRLCFHRRSMEQQRPLSTVTMAFTVVAFLIFVTARSHVAGMVIPICAAPLWLTPRHFILGTIAFYLAGLPFVLSVPFTHDDYVLCAMWVAIGIPTATTFHFGFYWFRLSHFLLEE